MVYLWVQGPGLPPLQRSERSLAEAVVPVKGLGPGLAEGHAETLVHREP